MSRNRCPYCESSLDASGRGAPRSLAQHKRYFAVMRQVFLHWPETHSRQFADEQECRKYLQMKAGYREIGAQIELEGIPPEKMMTIVEASIKAAGAYAVPVIHGDTLVIFKPKSIRFSRLAHEAFCSLNREVDDVIKAETGLDPETLLIESLEAA